ncbi:MAG TPA: tetratricopeptide repeat protein, partial [Gemmataceae bacterium]|nr:tetratricopeptide repeat protein [Gemmataceae bacterium]
IRLKKDYAKAHSNLGVAFMEVGRPKEAIAEYRLAIQLDKDGAEPYFRLASALRLGGDFQSALDTIHRFQWLRSADPRWRVAADQEVRKCQRLIELDEQLPGFLDKARKPSSAQEQIELAELCAIKRLHAAAIRFYEDAFRAQPGLLPDHRYAAACAAALAGCGEGNDVARLDEHQRERLRQQALHWLREELAKNAEQSTTRPLVLEPMLRHWQREQDLAGVRDADRLTRLPAAEQAAWRELWTEVDNLLRRYLSPMKN